MAKGAAHIPLHLRSREDGELVRRARAGESDAFAALVRAYYPVAYDLAHKLLGDGCDAEEVAQDAFVKIHRALDGFRGEASVKTWILRIVMRLSLNRRRDRARSAWRRLGLHRRDDADAQGKAAAQVAGVTGHGQTPETHYMARETRRLVLALVDDLPEPLRQALILSSFEDLSYEQIARVLAVPVGTVSSRIYSARRKLLTALEERGLL